MTDTTERTHHRWQDGPPVQVIDPDRHWLSHGAVLDALTVRAAIGPAVGSQEAEGAVAHLVVHSGSRHAVANGYTVSDPAVLRDFAARLLEAADLLEEARA